MMTRPPHARSLQQPARVRGFSLVEAVMSTMILSVMLVAALNTVGAMKASRYDANERTRGEALAHALMAEILGTHYEEPDDLPLFSRELGESNTSRLLWDDVDDYAGWSASPPETRNGLAIPGTNGLERSVAVEWVNPGDIKMAMVSDTGAKKITVTVRRGTLVIGEAVAIRTEAWPDS